MDCDAHAHELTEKMDTEHENETKNETNNTTERALTPGVSNEVGKLSLDDDQAQQMEMDDEVQVFGVVQYSDTKVRKKQKPNQRKKK